LFYISVSFFFLRFFHILGHFLLVIVVLFLQHPVLLLVFNGSPVLISPGDWIWRLLGEPLSALFEGAAHLVPTVSQLLLQALFTYSSQG
jgi:hypothetical protein